MSVEWLLKLHALNEAGRFDEVLRQAKPILTSRPRDYAVRLQVGRALVALGELKRAKTELQAAVKYSKGLAAWPWFYVAALHARSGEKNEMTAALNRALAIDPKIEAAIRTSPWFAAHLRRGVRSAKVTANTKRASGLRTPTSRKSRATGASRRQKAARPSRG